VSLERFGGFLKLFLISKYMQIRPAQVSFWLNPSNKNNHQKSDSQILDHKQTALLRGI